MGFGTCCHVGLSMELTQLNGVPVCHLQWMNASTVAVASISFILKVTYFLLTVFGNSKKVSQLIHGALKTRKKLTNVPRSRQKEMTLKVAWTVRIRRPAVAAEQADCSRLLDPRPRNSCRRVDCVSSEHWARWHKLQSALDKLFTPALSALCIAYLLPERHTATAQRAHEWQHAITADFIEMQWTTWYSWLEWTLLIYYLG